MSAKWIYDAYGRDRRLLYMCRNGCGMVRAIAEEKAREAPGRAEMEMDEEECPACGSVGFVQITYEGGGLI